MFVASNDFSYTVKKRPLQQQLGGAAREVKLLDALLLCYKEGTATLQDMLTTFIKLPVLE